MLSLYNQLIKNVIYVVGMTDFRDLLKFKNRYIDNHEDSLELCNVCNINVCPLTYFFNDERECVGFFCCNKCDIDYYCNNKLIELCQPQYNNLCYKLLQIKNLFIDDLYFYISQYYYYLYINDNVVKTKRPYTYTEL